MPYGGPPSPDMVAILADQNPWHLRGVVPDAYAPPVERPLAEHLWSRLRRDDPRRFLVVLGARCVGKTTAMYQTVRHLLTAGIDPGRLWWMPLDHPVLLRTTLADLVRHAIDRSDATADRPVHLFLDELVYAKDWDLWLKTFYDEQWPVRIVATSSATAALRGRRLESGVGRWLDLYLSPYSFLEYLELLAEAPVIDVADTLAGTVTRLPPRLPDPARTAELRRSFLLTGGFPELLLSQQGRIDDADRLLRSQQILRSDAVERAVYKDIPQSYGVQNPMALERLLYVLAAQVTGVLTPTSIARDLEMSQPTLDTYIGYLQQAFLVFTLPNYSGSEGTTQRRGRKLYFVDGAARNAALQRGLAPLDDPTEMGVLLENAAAAALHALAEQSGHRLFHWRDRNKYEVDLVLDDPAGPLAFEIGSSIRHSRLGLAALIDRHPRFRGGCYVVTPDSPRVVAPGSGSGIGSLPLDMFLLACGRQAAEGLRHRLSG